MIESAKNEFTQLSVLNQVQRNSDQKEVCVDNVINDHNIHCFSCNNDEDLETETTVITSAFTVVPDEPEDVPIPTIKKQTHKKAQNLSAAEFDDGLFRKTSLLPATTWPWYKLISAIKLFTFPPGVNRFNRKRFSECIDVLFDYYLHSKYCTKYEKESFELFQKRIVAFEITCINIEARLSESQINAVSDDLFVFLKVYNPSLLDKINYLGISSRNSFRVATDFNVLAKSAFLCEIIDRDCMALSGDSSSKNDEEKYVILVRMCKGRTFKTFPLVTQIKCGGSSAQEIADWLFSESNLLISNFPFERIVNSCWDGALNVQNSIQFFNDILTAYKAAPKDLVSWFNSSNWCFAHLTALVGVSMMKSAEGELIVLFTKFCCQKNNRLALEKFKEDSALYDDYGKLKAVAETRFLSISDNIEGICKQIKPVSEYINEKVEN
ncbi:hypothetical protein EIN_447070 [Entamoeba invadens IP1]|uniref:Uncharacterized protein n=1 Tax=Entamoeba invadens IP1 TaxID=370355 RepID=L7FLN4_ENTIV|nr:hypothetical protein EIN_447070 [Entamoeba invadens IP1]ELP89076.1 hypothetical protein EIN_447070 [Entamoeba invadens IP1]|eukprot:XP_004255847.1 hypothetical protein EIN_447070 [Entamoeba invadens IP1]